MRSILAGVVMVAVLVGVVRSETILLGAQVGAGHLPMNEWEDFAGFTYQHDRLGLYSEFSVTSRFAQRHALRFSLEWIKTSSSETTSVQGIGDITVEWDFEAIPFSASYEFALRQSASDAFTLLGVGAGYYMSDVTGKISGGTNPSTGERSGEGYGFHGYVRQTAPISERLSLSGMLRGRWANGMAFDDNEGDVAVEFTGVDVSIGLEWEI